MKLIKILAFFLALSLYVAFSAHAATIYNVLLDATGSISEQDRMKENAVAAGFIKLLYKTNSERAATGEPADQISVAWFGGHGKYAPTPYFFTSNVAQMTQLLGILGKEIPKLEDRAIYSAILVATKQTVQHEKDLGHSEDRNAILLFTGGKDTQSPHQVMQLVSLLYPNEEVRLMVVGVGPEAQVQDFSGIADEVVHIDNKDRLVEAFEAFVSSRR